RRELALEVRDAFAEDRRGGERASRERTIVIGPPARVSDVRGGMPAGALAVEGALVEAHRLLGPVPEHDRHELVEAGGEVVLEARGARPPEEARGAVRELVRAPLRDVRRVVKREGLVGQEALVLPAREHAALPRSVRGV